MIRFPSTSQRPRATTARTPQPHDEEPPEELELELPPDAGDDEHGDEPREEDHGIALDDDAGGLDDAPAGELPIGAELRELDTPADDGEDGAVDTGSDDVDFDDRPGEEGTGLDGMPDADVDVGELPHDEDGGAEGTEEDPSADVDEGRLPPLGEGDDGEGLDP